MTNPSPYQSALLLLSVLALGCGATGTKKVATEADAETTTAPAGGLAFGAPCLADGDCAGGLCLASDYAPFKFCTATCTLEEEGCPPPEGQPVTGFCTRLPAAFKYADGPICLPVCSGLPTCQAFSTLWERCDPPAYQGAQIYGTSTVRVCGAPSSNGKPVVDSGTCENWFEGYQAEYGTGVSVCRTFCEYLQTCGIIEADASLDCCGHGCIQTMVTADGDLNAAYEKSVKCFSTSFAAHPGPTACTQPPVDCEAEPKDPTPR